MCRLDTRIALLIAMLSLTACSGADRAVSPSPSDPPPSQLGAALVDDGLMQAALAIYEVALDPVAATASAELKATRTAQQNDDLYLLPVDRFFGVGDFEIRSVRRSESTLELVYTVHHPFDAPSDPLAPPTAANRADLGVTGMTLFLFDVPSATGNTYFSDVVANTSLVTDADAYYRPNDLLQVSLTANCFPYLRFVDESGNGTRNGLSNGGDPTGNFGADGWTRAEFGPANNAWTGYGVLHQGQSSTRTLILDLEAIATAPIRFEVALIAKYNDPRGGVNGVEKRANRLPPDAPDHNRFAYRMPHGSLDVEAIAPRKESGGFLADTDSSSTLGFHLVDWDARGTETTLPDLADDPDPTHVAQGAVGLPDLAICIPGVLGDASVIDLWNPATTLLDDDSLHDGDVAADSGRPDDALYYERLVTKPASTDQPTGLITGMVRATDPEDGLFGGYLTYLDGNLQPLAGTGPEPVTYQVFEVLQEEPPFVDSGWVAPFLGTTTGFPFPLGLAVAADGSTYGTGVYTGVVDFDPGPDTVLRDSVADGSGYCVKLTPDGEFEWVVNIGVGGFDIVGGAATTTTGDVYLAGLFSPPQDFDPGPDEEIRTEGNAYCLKLSADGEFLWVAIWDGTVSDVVADMTGAPRISGIFLQTIDLDPGPGVDEETGVTTAYWPFCVGLDASGIYQWGVSWPGGSGSHQYQPWAMAIDSTGATLVGSEHSGTADMDPGPGVTELTSNGMKDAYCIKLDADGEFEWARNWGGPTQDIANGIGVGPNDEVRVTGTFTETADLDPGPGAEPHTSNGANDAFCVALTSDGSFEWAASWGDFESEFWHGAAVDSTGAVRLVGSYGGSVDFDPGPDVETRTADSFANIACLALDIDGNFQWVDTWDSTLYGFNAAVAPDNSVRVIGSFEGTVDFDPGPGIEEHTADSTNFFVMKLLPNGFWE